VSIDVNLAVFAAIAAARAVSTAVNLA